MKVESGKDFGQNLKSIMTLVED